MNSTQVYACMQKMITEKSIYFDVIPSDFLDKIINTISFSWVLIVNLDPSHLRGSHFIVVARFNKEIEIYDSLGTDFKKYDKKYFGLLQSLNPTYNNIKHQLNSSSLCGGFCLRYLFFRLKGFPINSTIKSFSVIQSVNELRIKCFLKCRFGNVLRKLKYFILFDKCKCNQTCFSPLRWNRKNQ